MPNAKYYERNRAKVIAAASAWQKENKEHRRDYMREYMRKRRAADPAFAEKCREETRKSMARHYERARATTEKWRAANKEHVSSYNSAYAKQRRKELTAKACARNKERRKTDYTFWIMRIMRSRVHSALKGAKKSASSSDLLGCSYEQFRAYIESLFLDGMDWTNRSEWHVDHIRPIAAFDLNDPEQQRQAFHYTNQRPLWKIDNLRKGKKLNWQGEARA